MRRLPMPLLTRPTGLSVVIPVAYDYAYLWPTLRSCYGIADEIILGLDAARLTWLKTSYAFDDAAFRAGLTEVDKEHKIRLVEEDFHRLETSRQNATDERNRLSKLCAPKHWVVQIDADEVLLDPMRFRNWLLGTWWNMNVMAQWITVFKRFEEGCLVIQGQDEWTPVATLVRGAYSVHRYTAQRTRRSPLRLLHFSWGRKPEELRFKLKNWGHNQDFDVEAYFHFWESVTLENYQQVKNFHPLVPPSWPALKFISNSEMNALQHGGEADQPGAPWGR
jgi:hypothetical protein